MQAVRGRLRDLCLTQGLFADVMFQLDDGCLPAHKPLLMARCDMMRAMFSGDFREGSAKVVSPIYIYIFVNILDILFCKWSKTLCSVELTKFYGNVYTRQLFL